MSQYSAPHIPVEWPLNDWQSAPEWHEDASFATPDLHAGFFDSIPYQGKPTRVFAFWGLPKDIPAEGCPAVVLVHGGGQTAFADWVRLWNQRGYAAIAMDTCGCTAGGEQGKRPRHDLGGPAGWGNQPENMAGPWEDQWPYHAAAAIYKAHSLLIAQPGVDHVRVGITGVSWGAFLSCTASGLDSRYKVAAHIYGSGFLGENSNWSRNLWPQYDTEVVKAWLARWDPSHYLCKTAIPMQWSHGTNDFAFALDSWQRSQELTQGPCHRSLQLQWLHGGDGSRNNPEVFAVFDHYLKGALPIPELSTPKLIDGKLTLSFQAESYPFKAELLTTRALGYWQDRKWTATPIELDGSCDISVALPPETTQAYVNIVDAGYRVFSSSIITLA